METLGSLSYQCFLVHLLISCSTHGLLQTGCCRHVIISWLNGRHLSLHSFSPWRFVDILPSFKSMSFRHVPLQLCLEEDCTYCYLQSWAETMYEWVAVETSNESGNESGKEVEWRRDRTQDEEDLRAPIDASGDVPPEIQSAIRLISQDTPIYFPAVLRRYRMVRQLPPCPRRQLASREADNKSPVCHTQKPLVVTFNVSNLDITSTTTHSFLSNPNHQCSSPSST